MSDRSSSLTLKQLYEWPLIFFSVGAIYLGMRSAFGDGQDILEAISNSIFPFPSAMNLEWFKLNILSLCQIDSWESFKH